MALTRKLRLAWCVYILRCADASLYVGMSNDVVKRAATHNAGKGARYTRGRTPVMLAWTQRCTSRSHALRVEAQVKRLPRRKRLLLIDGALVLPALPRRV